MKRVETTPEQRAEILQRVDALRKQGKTAQEAWAEAGVGHYTNYFSWKRKGKKVAKPAKRAYRKRKLVVEEAPAPRLAYQIFVWEDGRVTREDFRRAA